MFRLRALFLLIAVAAPAADMSLTLLPNTELRAPLQGIPARDAERGQRLSALFRARGCAEPRLEQQQFSKRKPPNVVCTLPGESTEQIVVGAHFDTVAGSAGVLDNWAGAAMLPALYATLSAQPRRYTYVFVGFSSEEDGLIGSREYVNQIPKESRGNVRAMVNLDCMGAGTTKVGYSRSDKALSLAFLALAENLKIPAEALSYDRVGRSDHESFRRVKIPVLTLHSLTQQTLHVIHTDKDQVDQINVRDYYASYKLVAAFLVYLQTHFEFENEAAASR